MKVKNLVRGKNYVCTTCRHISPGEKCVLVYHKDPQGGDQKPGTYVFICPVCGSYSGKEA